MINKPKFEIRISREVIEVYSLVDITNNCLLDRWEIIFVDDLENMKTDLRLLGFSC